MHSNGLMSLVNKIHYLLPAINLFIKDKNFSSRAVEEDCIFIAIGTHRVKNK